MKNNKNQPLEKYQNWFSPKLGEKDKDSYIKTLTVNNYNNPNSPKIQFSTISYPNLSKNTFHESCSTCDNKTNTMKNNCKSNICNSFVQTTPYSTKNKLNNLKSLNQTKSYGNTNYYRKNVNKYFKETGNFNKNDIHLRTYYSSNTTYKIKKPKILYNTIYKDPLNVKLTNNTRTLRSLITRKIIEKNKRLIKLKNKNEKSIKSIVDSLLKKNNKDNENDNDNDNDNDNVKENKGISNFSENLVISPVKYINQYFEREPFNEKLIKSIKMQSEILGSRVTRDSFINNINQYYEEKTEFYNFQRPAGVQNNDLNKIKTNKLIHSMLYDTKDMKYKYKYKKKEKRKIFDKKFNKKLDKNYDEYKNTLF